MPHVQQTTTDAVQADVAASAARLRAEGATAIFTVGFCFGGGQSWLAAAEQDDLAGAIGFYGRRASCRSTEARARSTASAI